MLFLDLFFEPLGLPRGRRSEIQMSDIQFSTAASTPVTGSETTTTPSGPKTPLEDVVETVLKPLGGQ